MEWMLFSAQCGQFTLTYKGSTARIGTSLRQPDSLSARSIYSQRFWHCSWVTFYQRLWRSYPVSGGIRPILCRDHGGELETPFYPAHRFFNRGCGIVKKSGMAFLEPVTCSSESATWRAQRIRTAHFHAVFAGLRSKNPQGGNMKLMVFLIPVLLGHPASTPGQQPFAVRADRYLQPYVKMQDFSGCVLVASHREILMRKCYSDANYELSVPNTPQSKFHIASMTKMFTAAAIVLLDKQGKLRLADKLGLFIPNFPNGEKITILNLLEHTSGLPSYYSIPEHNDIKLKPVHFDDLIEIMRTKSLEFEPETKSSYSDTGYAFLAYIIEKVSGKSYSQFIKDEIFTSAEMHDSGAWLDTPPILNRSSGYQPWVGPHQMRNAPYYDKTIITGSGSLYSTIDDLYAWYQAVRDKRLFDIRALDYPYGWGERELGDRKFIEQGGRDPGYASKMAAFLDQDLVVILLSNIEVGANDAMVDGLEHLAFGDSPTPPAKRPAYALSHGAAAQYIGRYQVSPDMIMDVKAIDDAVFLRGPGGDYLPLDALAPDSFFYRQVYARITFRRDIDGKVDAILWNGDFVCKKIAGRPLP
jgi:CubicO group peptidase (beta-lactamase class C family)